MTDFKPEEKSEIKIGAWLISNGFQVFINRRCAVTDALCCGVFNISGEKRDKPDMVFTDSKEWFAVEIKTGDGSSKDMRNSRKIVGYYQNLIEGKTKYFVDGEKITPTYFLAASFYSPEGRLFQNETLQQNMENGKEVAERDENDARMKGMPQKEYNETFGLTRQIWDEWKPIKNKDFAVGALLSDKLNNGSGKPAIFVQKFNKRINKWQPPHRFYVIEGGAL